MSGRQKLLSLELPKIARQADLCVDWLVFGCVSGLRAWLRRGPHQFAQPDEILGSGRQREYPADTGQTAMTGLAETGDRLGPAEHLLNALAHPPTDRIARVAGRSTVDCRPPVRRVLRDMRRHIVLAQIGDEAGHIIGLVGTERDPVIAGRAATISSAAARSAVPVAKVNSVSTPERAGSPSEHVPNRQAWLAGPAPCGTTGHRDRWSRRASHCCASRRESPARHCGREPAARRRRPWGESSSCWPRLRSACRRLRNGRPTAAP